LNLRVVVDIVPGGFTTLHHHDLDALVRADGVGAVSAAG
jgi:hypothetical protein